MSAEKIFRCENWFFCLFFGRCLGLGWCFLGCWLVFCGAFLHGLWCASMLVSVTFAYVDGSAGKEISKEEGANSL